MPCYRPLKAYAAPGGISFDKKKSFGIPIELPCGRCLGCRLEKSKEWALRCVHEAHMHKINIFITLTYDDEHLPKGSTLVKSHFQKFIRSLRKKSKKKIRYYMCGEYGSSEKTTRPHYHAILFGYEFDDARLDTIRDGYNIYQSKILTSTWAKGLCEIGSVTFQSAAYCARYIVKKQKWESGRDSYAIIDHSTGEITGSRVPEYTAMSLKPGIGKSFYEKYKTDMFPHDYCVTPDGIRMCVPAYYRNLLKTDDPKLHRDLLKKRVQRARQNKDNTPDRLAVREICHTIKNNRLTRQLK